MLGVTVNAFAVVVGALLGLVLRKLLNESVRSVITQATGITVVVIGLMDAFQVAGNITMVLILILSMSIGGAIGSLLKLQMGIERFGGFLERKLAGEKESSIGIAFTSATMIFCIGAMVVYGSINAGLGDHSTLLVKSLLDGIIGMTLAASLGAGVLLSAIPVFVIEGIFALCAGFLNPLLLDYPQVKTMLSGIGGVLVTCIGINLLEIKKIRTGDMIPAILGCLAAIWIH